MLKHLLLMIIALTVSATVVYANQSQAKVILPIDKADPTNGKQMYTSYCAPCHGVDGRGHGSVTSELRTHPADLTVLAKANRGKFPDVHVFSVLQFGSSVRAHGTAEMPVWGPILGKINHVNDMDRELRLANLSRYLQDIQAK